MVSDWCFKSFWYGPSLSPVETLCLKSFLDHGHRVQLFCYSVPVGVPEGVEIREASEIYPVDRVFFYSRGEGKGSVAAFADLLRYRLLELEGGCWVDTDVVCLSNTLPVDEVFIGLEEPGRVNNAIIRLPAGHDIARACREHAEAIKPEHQSWGDTGPTLLTRLLIERHAMHLAAPVEVAYPVSWQDAVSFWKPSQAPTLKERMQGATFLHLWNEVIRRNHIDKYVRPPVGSFVAELAERHHVDWRTTATYDEGTIEKLERLRRYGLRIDELEGRLRQVEGSRAYKLALWLARVAARTGLSRVFRDQ